MTLSPVLSVTLCIVAPTVGAVVESCTVMFLGVHFLFTSSATFAVSLSHNTQRKTELPKLLRLDHGYFRRDIYGGSVLQLLYHTSYAVRSAFLATATLRLISCHIC